MIWKYEVYVQFSHNGWVKLYSWSLGDKKLFYKVSSEINLNSSSFNMVIL